ncbi:MAG: hypothetical protein K2J33_00805, partial [Alistipes sp.]|nr:hypothetical protein [Alistipes sp.]
GGTVTFEYVPVGEAKIRIVEDVNGNGEWDTGNVVERRQPERSEVYVAANDEDTFQIKANWESDIEIDLAAMFAPVTMQSLQELLDAREEARLRKVFEAQQKEGKNKKHDHDRDDGSSGGFGMGGAFSTSGGLGTGGFRSNSL